MLNWDRARNDQPIEEFHLWIEGHGMLPRIKQVRHLGEYRLELTFTDGKKGELDSKQRIAGAGRVCPLRRRRSLPAS